MADIEIDFPFSIHIDFVEYCEKHPSLDTRFTFSIGKKGEPLIHNSYRDWIECFVWNQFMVDMHKITRGDKLTASLHGFIKQPFIEVISNEEGICLVAYFTKQINFPNEINRQSNIRAKFAAHEVLGVYDKLNSFPKWW